MKCKDATHSAAERMVQWWAIDSELPPSWFSINELTAKLWPTWICNSDCISCGCPCDWPCSAKWASSRRGKEALANLYTLNTEFTAAVGTAMNKYDDKDMQKVLQFPVPAEHIGKFVADRTKSRPVQLVVSTLIPRHNFLHFSKDLRQAGFRFDDALTRSQQAERKSLSLDFQSLKAKGYQPYFQGSLLQPYTRSWSRPTHVWREKQTEPQQLFELLAVTNEPYIHVCCRPPAELHWSIYISVYYDFHVDTLIMTVVYTWDLDLTPNYMARDSNLLHIWVLSTHGDICWQFPDDDFVCQRRSFVCFVFWWKTAI